MKRINWKKLRKTYETGSKISLKKLAGRYHVNYGTVRNHKAKYHWNRDDVTSRQAVDILDKYGLTKRQRLFCEYYLKSYNAYEAYQNAFKCKSSTAHTNAYRLLRNKTIQTALSKLHKKQAVSLHIDRSDVLNKMIRTFMSADPGKFIRFGNRKVTSKNGREYHRSFAYFKNHHGDTSSLQGIGLSKDGTPTVNYPDMNRLGAFLYQILPSRVDPNEQHGMPGSLYYALVHSVRVNNHQDELKHEVKSLKLKLKSKDRNSHEN